MENMITVKGIGNISVKPDLIIVTIHLESIDMDYQKMMEKATDSVKALEDAVMSVGFKKSDLKTTNFNIGTRYENFYDSNNKYINKFVGYVCEQDLKLEFDLDLDLLSNLIDAITKSMTDPKFNIQFTVKDKYAVTELLLVKATENARQKAEVLTKASKVTLGNIVSIDYDWKELNVTSLTRYNTDGALMAQAKSFAPNIEPDDINVSDTVTFTWWINQ